MAGISVTIHDNFTEEMAKRLGELSAKGEHALANMVAKDTEDYVPAMNKVLTNATKVFGNVIFYPPPYARYLYYGKVMVDRETGLPAFRIVGKDGSEVFRFRKGAKLKVRKPEKKLNISRSVHHKATDHWIEASKQDNMKKWEQFIAEMVKNGVNTR